MKSLSSPSLRVWIRLAAITLCLPPGISNAQNLDVLYTFGGNELGETPAGLTQDANGNFYGVSVNGGTNDWGAVFKLTSAGTISPLYSFKNPPDGENPYASLTQGTNGYFYGLDSGGGSNDWGSIFQISSNGAYSSLYSFLAPRGAKFTNATGCTPRYALTLGTNGNFYGTTTQGGANGYGVIFELTHAGKVTVLYCFSNSIDGGVPEAPLLQFTNGNLYGTTTTGGTNDYGTVFQLSAAGKVTPLYSFTNGIDGATPRAALINGKDGNLYGTCAVGGLNGTGTIFKVTTKGVLTPLYSFSAPIYYPDSELYYNDDGASPETLLLGADDNFYGVAYYGGANGTGSLYQLTRANTLNVLYPFSYSDDGTNADGANPISLIQSADGNFYGMAYDGGTNSYGTFFRFGLPPQITLQPANVSIALHSNAMFSVAATGATGFQWQFNDTNINHATNTNLFVQNAQAANAGLYQVVVTNLNGVVTSSVVTFNITNVSVSFVAGASAVQYSGGQLTLELTNLTGQGTIVIETSTDLLTWTPIYTNPPGYGVLQFTDTNATAPAEFYRTIVVP